MTLAKNIKGSHRRLLKIGGGALALILVAKFVVIAIAWNEPLNQFRRALAERHEQRSDADEFGDYSLYISGRLPVSRFKEMAELLGLSGKLHEELNGDVGWQINGGQPWWDLPESFEEEYHQHGNGYSVLLGRSGDRVFYQALSW